jgi:hypothetical protein
VTIVLGRLSAQDERRLTPPLFPVTRSTVFYARCFVFPFDPVEAFLSTITTPTVASALPAPEEAAPEQL